MPGETAPAWEKPLKKHGTLLDRYLGDSEVIRLGVCSYRGMTPQDDGLVRVRVAPPDAPMLEFLAYPPLLDGLHPQVGSAVEQIREDVLDEKTRELVLGPALATSDLRVVASPCTGHVVFIDTRDDHELVRVVLRTEDLKTAIDFLLPVGDAERWCAELLKVRRETFTRAYRAKTIVPIQPERTLVIRRPGEERAAERDARKRLAAEIRREEDAYRRKKALRLAVILLVAVGVVVLFAWR